MEILLVDDDQSTRITLSNLSEPLDVGHPRAAGLGARVSPYISIDERCRADAKRRDHRRAAAWAAHAVTNPRAAVGFDAQCAWTYEASVAPTR